MRTIFLEHFARWTAMEPQDAVKLAYQSAFGGGHMIPDRRAALRALREEASRTPQAAGSMLLEPIGGGLCRLHLCALEGSGLRPETVNALFCHTADHARGTPAQMEEALAALDALAAEGRTPFPAERLEEYLRGYRAAGMPSVHHSEAFRRAYAPAYRLVPARTAALLPLLRRIDAALLAGERPALPAAVSGEDRRLLKEIYAGALRPGAEG